MAWSMYEHAWSMFGTWTDHVRYMHGMMERDVRELNQLLIRMMDVYWNDMYSIPRPCEMV